MIKDFLFVGVIGTAVAAFFVPALLVQILYRGIRGAWNASEDFLRWLGDC